MTSIKPGNAYPLALNPSTVLQGRDGFNPHEDQEVMRSLPHYVRLLKRQLWKIAIAVTLVTAAAAVAAYTLTPMYESTARIDIDMKIPSSVLGEVVPGGTTASEGDQIFNTEMQLLQSDAVVRSVADRFHLLSDEVPEKGAKMVDPANAPVTLKNLTITRVPNSYLLNVSYRSPDPNEAAAVANAVANSYIDRGREMRARSSSDDSAFMETQIVQLKKNMDDSSLALAGYEQKLGLINSDEKTSILSARLLQLNTEYTEAENDRIRKESAYRSLLSGSTAAIEISPQATDLSRLATTLRDDQQHLAKLRAIYGTNNGEYKQAASDLAEVTRQYDVLKNEIALRIETDYKQSLNRERMLSDALKQGKAKADGMSANSAEYQQLKREALTDKTLYDELFRKVKEAGINGGFHSNTVRISDMARPSIRPVFPNKAALILVAFFTSLILSILTILIADMFDKSFRDMDDAARTIDADILGTLPYVRQFHRIEQRTPAARSTGISILKTQQDSQLSAPYADSVATILNAIIMGQRDRQLRSILVTSSIPGEGKSTCVTHMAKAFALQGMRTLVIDADLRKPKQQRHFGLSTDKSVVDAIQEELPLSEAVHHIEGYTHLDVLTAVPASEYIHRIGSQVKHYLSEAMDQYDMVFIDAPPMICFAETIQLACMADGVLVIGQAGQTDRRAIRNTVATLRRLRAHILGVVLNGVTTQDGANYGYVAYGDYAAPSKLFKHAS